MSTVTSKPEGTIETSIGTVRFHMTNATHVYLYTKQPAEKVTIRQIPYKLNYHCYLQNEQWDRNANDLNAWAEPGLSRKDKYAETSHAARKTAREILNKAWAAHLAAHPELTRLAAAANAEDLIERLQDELDDLESKAAAVKEKLYQARLARAVIG